MWLKKFENISKIKERKKELENGKLEFDVEKGE